ncbi:MAG: hypothetical protein ACRCY4_10655, partial [Brevinema sp.]
PLYFTNKYGIKFINSDSCVFDSNQLTSASNIQESFKYKFLLIQREIHQDIPSANELIKRAIELQDYDNFELNDILENDLLIIYLMYTEAELLRGYLLENILTLEKRINKDLVDLEALYDPSSSKELFVYIFQKLLPKERDKQIILFFNSLFQYPSVYSLPI